MSCPRVKVREIAEQIRGVTFDKAESSKSPATGTLPVLRANNITDSGLVFEDLVYVPKRRISSKQLLQEGDVVIAASSGSLDVVGKAAMLKRPFEGGFGAFCKVLRPRGEVDPSYFAHFFLTSHYRRRISALAAGANINNLKNEHLDNLELPLPPMEEQRRIAAILDQAEALRAQRRAAIALLDQLPQAIFLEMFGDPVSNPMRWPLDKLGTLGTLDRGVSRHRPRNAPELLGGAHPLIQTGDVANSDGYIRSYTSTYSDIGLKQSKKWPTGTLCITIAANIAKTGILTFDACFPDSVVGFTSFDRESTQYVQVWLSLLQRTLEDSAPESAQKNINLDILRNLPIPIPPKELRGALGARLRTVNLAKTAHQSALASLDTLCRSLQASIFARKSE